MNSKQESPKESVTKVRITGKIVRGDQTAVATIEAQAVAVGEQLLRGMASALDYLTDVTITSGDNTAQYRPVRVDRVEIGGEYQQVHKWQATQSSPPDKVVLESYGTQAGKPNTGLALRSLIARQLRLWYPNQALADASLPSSTTVLETVLEALPAGIDASIIALVRDRIDANKRLALARASRRS